ncbi:MAG: hypothetical protein HKN80_10645 [Acidimicrobiia bacterium]|nr:hypothetical protein [Acidimicrobiia bacterium]
MRTRRALIVIALLVSACTSVAQTDSALLPPVTTSTVPSTTSTLPPATTTTTLPADRTDIVVWLTIEAAGASLAEAVAAWQGVSEVRYVSAAEAFEELVEFFADRPELVAGVNPEGLPTSLRVNLTHPSFLGDVAAQLRSLSDVAEVATAVTPACNAFPDWNVVLFVHDDRALSRLRNDLLAIDGIEEVSVIGRDEAFAEYLDRFEEWPDLAGVITVSDMSVSLRSRTDDPVALTLLPSLFEADPDVKGMQVFLPGAPDCG